MTERACWACLNTGRIIDCIMTNGTVRPGPEHDKPCHCPAGDKYRAPTNEGETR